MADETRSEEQSYHDWLTEALTRDEKTWEALERKMKALRLKQGALDADGKPRDC